VKDTWKDTRRSQLEEDGGVDDTEEQVRVDSVEENYEVKRRKLRGDEMNLRIGNNASLEK
jgi:hypothetical protein